MTSNDDFLVITFVAVFVTAELFLSVACNTEVILTS